jgi:hypothetical protein
MEKARGWLMLLMELQNTIIIIIINGHFSIKMGSHYIQVLFWLCVAMLDLVQVDKCQDRLQHAADS